MLGSIQMGQVAIISQNAFEFEGTGAKDGGWWGNEFVKCVSDGRDVVLETRSVSKKAAAVEIYG